jgi:hypothetical protein
MVLEKKKELIQSLNEADLREKVLIPLFSKMGFIDPILHHHSNEKGKDIILKEFDTKFKKTLYLAVVVKAGNVTGSASGNSNYFTLINQIKQSLNEPYKHIYELKEVIIDQVIIVISGKFLPTSLESIYSTLKSERLDKAIREPIDIGKLIGLIDEYFSEYWEEYKNEQKSLLDQRNNLLNNLSKLSKVLFPEFKDQELFLNKVSKSEYDIDLLPYKSLVKYIANVGYKKISIDEIDEFYTDSTILNNYGDIKKQFFEIKENTKKVLYEIDEVVEILKSILNEKNPEKLVELAMDLDYHTGRGYGGGRLYFSTNDIECQEDFGYTLREYREKKELLIENNILDFYKLIVDKISSETTKELISFFNEHTKDETSIWLGLKIKIDLQKRELLELNYYKFEEKPKILEEDTFIGSTTREIERISKSNNSEIKIEIAINNYGFWRDDECTNEKKAKSFVWHFESGFEKMFLEFLGYEVE